MKKDIVVARGDGIGPEIMDASLEILRAAGAKLDVQEVVLGEKAFLAGHASGIEPAAWDAIRTRRVLFKAPLTTPQGGGYKSVNVTLRKSLGLFANVRPARSYAPALATKHPDMDVIVVRENEEDVYGGIEHQHTDEVTQCLKLITRPGSERICRYAFEVARAHGRRRVTCFTKDNIMKLTDGLFHQVFQEVAKEYPDIEAEHRIIDIGAAQLAATPEVFDVLVVPNLYGDILSDIAAQLVGSVGLAASSNVGENVAMFEAVHGSAPDLAGQGLANPSGLLLSGVQMLLHLGQVDVAERVANAWLTTLEQGIHPGDLYREGHSQRRVNTREFTDAVIERLGQEPKTLTPARFTGIRPVEMPQLTESKPAKRDLVGIDVFLRWNDDERKPERLAESLGVAGDNDLKLTMITNRGQKVWPNGFDETFCTDHWRCRFEKSGEDDAVEQRRMFDLLDRIDRSGLEVIKTEHLYLFDGRPGYSAGQGQ